MEFIHEMSFAIPACRLRFALERSPSTKRTFFPEAAIQRARLIAMEVVPWPRPTPPIMTRDC